MNMVDEYILGAKWSGVSMGLEHKFRLIKTNSPGDYVIFDYTTGKVVEHIPPKENEFFTKEFAMQRLYQINGLNNTLDKDVLEEIDPAITMANE